MTRPSEFEVQALAYWNLKRAFPTVRGEYKIQGARLDIAIFDESGSMILIVEVKKSSRGKSTTQGERYSAITGVPAMYIRGMDDAYNAVSMAHNFLLRGSVLEPSTF